ATIASPTRVTERACSAAGAGVAVGETNGDCVKSSVGVGSGDVRVVHAATIVARTASARSFAITPRGYARAMPLTALRTSGRVGSTRFANFIPRTSRSTGAAFQRCAGGVGHPIDLRHVRLRGCRDHARLHTDITD